MLIKNPFPYNADTDKVPQVNPDVSWGLIRVAIVTMIVYMLLASVVLVELLFVIK